MQAGKRPARLPRILMLALVVGATAAVAALPVGAIAGLTIKDAADAYNNLPSYLQIPPNPQTTYVYASDGKTLLTTFYDENRRDVALNDIAPVMQQAMVAAEDTRYWQHGGVDIRSIFRAAVANFTGGQVSQGASTLTMQYVRNVIKNNPNLTPEQRVAATADTFGRKVQEMRYAQALESRFTKKEILNRYLNIAYFGDGAYGIYAAARTFFDTSPDKLTLAQAALIAGLVQSPDTDNPVTGDQKAALYRRNYVLESMAKMNVITEAQAQAAEKAPLGLRATVEPDNCLSALIPGSGFFCDYVRQWWDSQPAFGATVADREQALKQGGYTIVTSLNPTVLKAATAQSLAVYGYDNPKALPIAVVQPGTGRVLALAVNRHYSLAPNATPTRGYPNTVDQLIAGGGGVLGYQSGSTFKMFTMLAALEAGKPLNTKFNAPSPLHTTFPISGPNSCGGYYCPVNENPSWMDGVRTMWTGYGRSVNTYFVWLESQIGPQNAVNMAENLGIKFRAASDAALAKNASEWGAFTLGVTDTTPLDLANAYATVAAGGKYCNPLPVVSITDATGHKVSAADPSCRQAVPTAIANAAADAARCPIGEQSAYGQCNQGTAMMVSSILGGRPAGGKTGSSEQNATETFVGFTAQVAAAGIAADPDYPSDYVGAGVSAYVDIAVARTMAVALQGQPWVSFPAPTLMLAFGTNDPNAIKNNSPSNPGTTTNPTPATSPSKRRHGGG